MRHPGTQKQKKMKKLWNGIKYAGKVLAKAVVIGAGIWVAGETYDGLKKNAPAMKEKGRSAWDAVKGFFNKKAEENPQPEQEETTAE